ncbi:MAG TPA: tetratricopeptide repeat protein [Planctomycetota bacterium]|nr:tetratricopeptide repeat protein [Planctomycetota bacterium]
MAEETLSLTDAARTKLDRLGLEFLAEVLGFEARERPDNSAALVSLGMVLTQLGRYQEGLAIDRRLVELHPEDSTAHYNLGCSLALLGERESALDALEEAVRKGYDDAPHLMLDPDLASLHAEPRFQALRQALEKRA